MKSENRHTKPFLLLAFLGASIVALGGCDLINPGDPEEARVVIEGADGHPIQLLTSNDFQIVAANDGEDNEISLLSSDTSTVAAPYGHTFDLGSSLRFYAHLSSDEISSELIRVKVYVDGDLRYDRSTDFDEEVLEFIYSFH